MPEIDHQTEFVMNITRFQGRLYAYILSLLCDPDQAGDVLQETNLVLWSKAEEFEPGSNFASWAYCIAHFQVMAHRKRSKRDKLIFDDAALEALRDEAAELGDEFDARQAALQHCLKLLNPRQSKLISLYYSLGQPVKSIAESLNQSANAVNQALFRARMALVRCVREQLPERDLPEQG